jgi:hypothetical protein
MIVNDELAGMWTEALMAYFKFLSRHFSTGTEKYNEKSLDRTASFHTKYLNLDLPNTNYGCYCAVSKLGPKCLM